MLSTFPIKKEENKNFRPLHLHALPLSHKKERKTKFQATGTLTPNHDMYFS